MKLSAQEEYGLRCLLHMASKGDTASHSIPEISRAEGLSIPNVAKLMRILRMGGYVASARGQAGGYTLSRPASEIQIGPVLELLGGRLCGPSFCDRHSGLKDACVHVGNCSIRPIWQALQAVTEQLLGQLSLQDLIKEELSVREVLVERVRMIGLPATAFSNLPARPESLIQTVAAEHV